MTETKTLAIRHAGVVVSDMQAALAFYGNFLGLKPTRKVRRAGPYMDTLTDHEGVDVEIHLLKAPDGGLVELLQFHSHSTDSAGAVGLSTVGRLHLALTVGDLDALYRAGTAAGVKFVTPPVHSPDNVKVCFCRDPDDTLVELVEPLGPDASPSPYPAPTEYEPKA